MKIINDFVGWGLAIASSVIIVYLLIFNPFLYKGTPADVEVVESIPHRTNTMVINDVVVKPKFNPHKREFTLDDGTPCVFISVPSYSSRKADASGVSCDWGYQDDHEQIF